MPSCIRFTFVTSIQSGIKYNLASGIVVAVYFRHPASGKILAVLAVVAWISGISILYPAPLIRHVYNIDMPDERYYIQHKYPASFIRHIDTNSGTLPYACN